ncbi:MAG: dihydrodipicolinate synthase family protein [Bacteroidota bacterium]
MKKLPEGLWPVMLTAFKPDNTLDLDGVRKLTDMYLDSGSNGMFANCLSSEMYQLTNAERLELTRTVVNHCRDKVPVVATGTFYQDSEKNAEFIKKIYDLGVDAVIIISSLLAEPEDSDEVLKQRLEEIMERTGNIPLGLYECPVPYKRVIKPDMMGWLAETGRFFYHKDTTCNAAEINQKVAAIEDTDFHLYNADTVTALDSLRGGAHGISPISGNFYPELYGHYMKLYRAGKMDELEALHINLAVMDRITHDVYPWSAKFFLEKRGFDMCTNTRIPMSKMGLQERNRHDDLFRMFEKVMKDFGVKSVI